MNSGELNSDNDRSARSGSSSRREFLGRTIRGGALLAATTVLGNELPTPESRAESKTNSPTQDPSSSSRATTADLLVEKLVEWGVSMVFGLPGDKIAMIMEALRRRQDKIQFVLVRHEEGAAFMASGYAKFTGKLGVCVSTAGPGSVHLLNGLYDAKFDGVPVLAITGSPPRALLGTRFTQGVDTISLYDDVTGGVYNELITGPYHLLSVADGARRAALARRGVAHLSFPIDVQAKPLADDDESLGADVQHGTASNWVPQIEVPAPDAVRAAADLLNTGRRTAFLVGRGALGATMEVEAFAERRAAPVVKAFLGKTVIADTSPYSTGGIGEFGTTASSAAMQGCDTLLIAGSTMPWLHYYPKPGQARIVQIDRDPTRLGLRVAVDVAIVGDVRRTLTDSLPFLEPQADRTFLDQIRAKMSEWNQALHRIETSSKMPLQPQVVARQVSELLAADALVSFDCGSNTFFAARHISMVPTQKLAVGGNLSTMACGLPFVIAAQLAYPNRQCVAFVGDGGFTMLMGEFATAVKYKLPIKVIVLKNNHYSRIVSENKALGIPPFGTELQPIDFMGFAVACGGVGFACARAEEVRPVLEAAWRITDRPVLVEAAIDNDADVSPPNEYLSYLSQT
ncbi:MAG TPA: thiamine pyrophosphate-binding protein [Chthoniobacterales bacterium]|nr:thiamine pyrophosphate-binding protein [Chthoniobacterales bacterium]